MSESTSVPVKAVRVSFEIVNALQQLGETGVGELAAHLDSPTSTIHDHLRTLEELQLVVNDDGQYRLGTKFLEFGGYARQRLKIYGVARPEIVKLAERTGEHANLMIEEHGLGVFLFTSEGRDAVQLDTYNGYRVLLQTTAMGKAILAHLPERKVRSVLDRHGMKRVTDATITAESELFEELERIQDRGYALDREERVKGMWCVGAPILIEGTVVGAISVSGPKSRMQGERFETEIPNHVLKTANVIEVNMAYV